MIRSGGGVLLRRGRGGEQGRGLADRSRAQPAATDHEADRGDRSGVPSQPTEAGLRSDVPYHNVGVGASRHEQIPARFSFSISAFSSAVVVECQTGDRRGVPGQRRVHASLGDVPEAHASVGVPDCQKRSSGGGKASSAAVSASASDERRQARHLACTGTRRRGRRRVQLSDEFARGRIPERDGLEGAGRDEQAALRV